MEMQKQLILVKAVFVMAIILLGSATVAQQTHAYERISITEGLSQGMVFDMLQDKEGFIWVATKNGLNRYDGYNFKVFVNDPYNVNSLSSNVISTLFEDSKGRLWIGTENAGINVYDKKTGRFKRIVNKPGDAGSLWGNRIRCSMTELADGRIIVYSENAGLNIVNAPENFFENDNPPQITRLALPNNTQAVYLFKNANADILISCSDNKLYKFEIQAQSFDPVCSIEPFNGAVANADGSIFTTSHSVVVKGQQTYPLFKQYPTMFVTAITKDAAGKVWLGFEEGLYAYDISKWQPGNPINAPTNLIFEEKAISLNTLMIDRAGFIWVGTKGFGLCKFNLGVTRFKQVATGNSIRYIVPDNNGNIFFGGWKYNWLLAQKDMSLDNSVTGGLHNDSLINKVNNNRFTSKKIEQVLASKDGDYWIKTTDSAVMKYNPVTKAIIEFPLKTGGIAEKQLMLEDKKGNLWVSGNSGLLIRINPGTGKTSNFTVTRNTDKSILPKEVCTDFYEDSSGVFWMATEEGFAKLVFIHDVPQTTWYKNSVTNRNSLNYNLVSCFLDDPSDNNFLWIGTKGGGLNRLDKSTGNFFHLTTKEGLPNDVVYGILADSSGNIWGSTNRGIFCLMANKSTEGKNWLFRNFTKADGLQDDEFNTYAYAKLPDGELAFGGVNGLNIFNPREILNNSFTPNVFITNILINNQPVTPGDKNAVLQNTIEQTKKITLNYLQDILTLEFTSLDFTAPDQNRYRYQLVGIDKEWVESGTRRTATYVHLPAGNYNFKVQGSNSQGIWSNNMAELRITVLPPWWRSWWAYLFYILLLGLGVRAYFKFTVKRAKLKSQLHYEQQEAKRIKELDSIKTQLYANITHEFRTPLTVILGMTQQVKDNPGKHLNSGTDMIMRNGQNLLNLVNEMLDLSKLEDGKMTLNLVNGDLINFLRYIVESFQSLATSQQKQFHFLSGADELMVVYDAEKIRQIITNLLSNALKFTPAYGNAYVSISQEPSANDNVTVVLKVIDTGIGIPENQLERIFDRFYQLDNNHTRKTDGTGIGLALTKELVKLMNGKISVKSPAVGSTKGTEFTISLPLQKTNRKDDSVKVMAPPVPAKFPIINTAVENEDAFITNERSGPALPLILLVEDNPDVVAYTASCLPDYTLAVGKDGNEGLDIATGIIPDLIITDVMMPFVDGFEMCKRLRQDERTSHIPIIMLTAKADMKSKLEGLDMGADVYLEKPFHKEELLLRIKKLLEMRKLLQQHYSKEMGIAATPVVSAAENAPVVKEQPAEHAFVKKVKEVVEAHITNDEFTVERLCKLVFMSHSQLHRKLEALTGYSPNKFIRIIRLNKAKKLLGNPSLSIATIAPECGYNDPAYFARVFKQEYGLTPQEWRLIHQDV